MIKSDHNKCLNGIAHQGRALVGGVLGTRPHLGGSGVMLRGKTNVGKLQLKRGEGSREYQNAKIYQYFAYKITDAMNPPAANPVCAVLCFNAEG